MQPKFSKRALLDNPKTLAAVLFLASSIVSVATALAAPKRVFMAPDDHTDYFWSATDVEYEQYFLTMLDYYLNQVDATANEPADHQSRFSADGTLWLRAYEKNRTPASFQRLVDAIKSHHLSAPINPLVITYGGVPAEAVIRSMYYGGQVERRYGLNFPIAIAMENATMPYGLSSLWAGSGAKYSWKGVCGCFTTVPNLDNRANEIYRSEGPDATGVILKWFSLRGVNGNQDLGGYAEARFPDTALDEVTVNANSNGFAARYPYNTIGVFGQGWDDLQTTNLNIQQTCKAKTDSTRQCIVSDMRDFFEEFAANYGASLPTVRASFGNEWDLSPASMAEVSARVKRSLEKLRSAEALATLVALKNPTFLNGRDVARDLAFLNFGLYFEHDFENGGPRVSGAQRIAWQRKVAGEIENYTNTFMADVTTALGAMIQKSGANQRFFVANALSWTRTDIADIPYSGTPTVHVVDLSTGAEAPSQLVTVSGTQYLRVQAQNIPSVGYKVFEIQSGIGQAFSGAPTATATTGIMENDFYKITVAPRGAITSFIDKRLGNREFAGTTGGFALNDLGGGTGTLSVENAGSVSVTLVATGSGPLAHTTRITLIRGSDRVAIQNEVTQNFGGTQLWRFSINVTNPSVRHEEVGAIINARLTTSGGDYSPVNARYYGLTLNHFADMTGDASAGLTISNADAYFMALGSSSNSNLDTLTPQISVILGASLRPSNPIVNQAGDSYVMQRFALQSHAAYDQAASMRFSLEHQNPLAVGAVSGGTAYPETTYSYLSISDPNVLLWSLKPAEEGIGEGVVARVWNVASTSSSFSLNLNGGIASAKSITHIETDKGDASISAGALTSPIAQQQLLSYRLFPSSLLPGVKIVPTDARITEVGDPGSFTITRSGSAASDLTVAYSVSGTATQSSDYQALSGTATIPAGASSTTIALVPVPDTASEPEETITVTLTSQPAYLVGAWNSATASIINDASGGTSPTVAITAPASGATVSGTVTVSATASDDVGVLGVQFKLDGANLGAEDTSSPYSIMWSTTATTNGNHTLTATARDAAGNQTTSTAVPVTVNNATDTAPPTVSVTAPSGGASVSGTVTISANAADNLGVAGVQFFVNGSPAGAEDTTSPYSTSWNTTAVANGGPYNITARARDAAGNQTTSAAVAVTVNNTTPPPPSGLVSAYGFNEGTGNAVADVSGSGNNGTISNTAWDSVGRYGAALSFNGSTSRVTVPDSASLDLTTGMTMEAWVRPGSATGWRTVVLKEQSAELVYALYASNDANRPSAHVYIGGGLDTVGTAQLPVNTWTHLATTYDGSALRLYINGAQVSSRTLSGSILTSTGALRIGSNAVWGEFFSGLIDEVRIYNRALTANEIQTDMNTPIQPSQSDTTSPTVAITAPASGATVSGMVTVSATASDSVGVMGVQFKLDGANLGAEDTSSPYSIMWNTTATTNGNHTLTATARDAAGNVGAATNVPVTVSNSDTTPPSIPTGLTATATSSTQINIAWTASSDNVGVTGYRIRRNGTVIATTPTTSYQNTGLSPGTTHTYTVAAYDASNNFSAESAAASATTPTSPPPGPTPVLSYRFQEGAGITTVDGSGNGNTGTLTNGPTWTTAGKYGNAINFDGTNDFVTAPNSNSLSIGNTGTIEAWVYFNTLNRRHGIIAKGSANRNRSHNYAVELDNSNRFQCILGNGTSRISLDSTITPAIRQFYHIACVWTGTTVQLYINGALNASTAQTFVPAANVSPLYIGQFGGNTDRFQGIIDEVRIYNQALTQTQIQNDMNTP